MEKLPPILHFNTHAVGGAATAARKIHESLVANGIDSRYHFIDGDVDEPTYTKLSLVWRHGVLGRLVNSVSQRLRTRVGTDTTGLREPFGWSTMPGRLLSLPLIDSNVIIHLHWVVGLVDYRRFFAAIPASTPIVWTLHDMNPLTGGCHYSWECTRFTDRCRDCTQLRRPARRSAAASQNLRATALAHCNLHVVANSRWIEQQARKSRIFESARSFGTIRLAVDLEVFRPQDPSVAKRALGIPESRRTVGFGASRLDAPRKGFSELCAALARLNDTSDLELLTFGDRGNVEGPEGIAWSHLGPVSSNRKLATIYNAADVFVMPSLQEAVGQTALEALACATPVVANDVGGVSEFVIPDRHGLLSRSADTEDLADALRSLLADAGLRRRMGHEARRFMTSTYSLEQQAASYISLYRHLVEDRR